jgi:hypothetical protein
MRRPPKYVQAFIDRSGKSRFYFRRPGFKSVPLPGLPWSPEFMATYEAAMGGETAPRVEMGACRTKPGTINALVVSYYKSDEWTRLTSDTQKSRRRIIERFRAQHGDKRVAFFDKSTLSKSLARSRGLPPNGTG